MCACYVACDDAKLPSRRRALLLTNEFATFLITLNPFFFSSLRHCVLDDSASDAGRISRTRNLSDAPYPGPRLSGISPVRLIDRRTRRNFIPLRHTRYVLRPRIVSYSFVQSYEATVAAFDATSTFPKPSPPPSRRFPDCITRPKPQRRHRFIESL